MTAYIIRRLIYLVIQLLIVCTLVFLLLRLVPGNPAYAILGNDATPDQIAALEHQLGLDEPIQVQYVHWLGKVVRGNLGTSAVTGRSVSQDIRYRLGNTVELAFFAVLLSFIAGVVFGVVSALRADGPADYTLGAVAMFGLAIPSFVVGTVLLLIFALVLRWLPQSEFATWGQNPVQHFKELILPVVTLAASSTAVVMRMMRSTMLEVIREDYIRTARAKGLSSLVVVTRHMLKNALNPVLSIVGLEFSGLLGGTVIVETIYGWPGISSLLLTGVSSRDYPVVQGVVLVIAVITIVINLLVDIGYGFLDPRVRYE